jgi:hypothetical protein
MYTVHFSLDCGLTLRVDHEKRECAATLNALKVGALLNKQPKQPINPFSVRDISLGEYLGLEYEFRTAPGYQVYDRFYCVDGRFYTFTAQWAVGQPRPAAVNRAIESFKILKPHSLKCFSRQRATTSNTLGVFGSTTDEGSVRFFDSLEIGTGITNNARPTRAAQLERARALSVAETRLANVSRRYFIYRASRHGIPPRPQDTKASIERGGITYTGGHKLFEGSPIKYCGIFGSPQGFEPRYADPEQPARLVTQTIDKQWLTNWVS